MFSNEPGFHVEIMNAMARNIWGNYSDDPDIENAESQTVEGLAHSYVDIYNKLRIQRINEQVLSKYDLTLHAFVKNQAGIENGLRRKLKKEIDAFKMPENDVIFVGLDDKYWSHIYLIQENVITCRDYEGYAVIGAGCYSADLVFNQYSYSPGFLEPEAMYITFLAKRRAEVTPTVGKMTDMHVVRGGKEFDIVSDKTIAFLDDLHKQKKETETKHWESQIRELTKRIHEEKNS